MEVALTTTSRYISPIPTSRFIKKFTPEICTAIVNHLQDDSRTLIALSTVCRDCLPATRLHLFRRVYLHTGNYKKFFDIIQSPTATLLPSAYVRKLHLRQSRRSSLTRNQDREWFAVRLPHMQGFNVRELSLDNYYDGAYPNFPPLNLLPTLSSNFQSVTTLVLTEPQFTPFALLIATITCLRDLRHLSLEGGTWPEDGRIPQPQEYQLSPHIGILYLNLEDQMLYDILCWLNQFPGRLPSIHTLLLGQPTSIEACLASADLVGALGSTLQHLTLSWFADLSGLDLAQCTRLKSLFIDGVDLLERSPVIIDSVDWGVKSISSISSLALERVIFGLAIHRIESLDRLDWQAMRDSFMRLPGSRPIICFLAGELEKEVIREANVRLLY